MESEAAPALSIVIPTAGGRCELLRRAVQSSLACEPANGIEVLVVRNGGDRHGCGEDDGRTRYFDIPHSNANAARNIGLHEARGTFVRFLDDDDFLEPEGVLAQLYRMQTGDYDVSTGAVRFVDSTSRQFDGYIPGSRDFVVELFSQRASTLPVAQMFRRTCLVSMRWDPGRRYLQDVEWMHSIMRSGEIRWLPFHDVVGNWNHHDGPRTSIVHGRWRKDGAARDAVAIILASARSLEKQGRLTGERRGAVAIALWAYAHSGFRYAPRDWLPIAGRALELDPQSRPPGALMGLWPLSSMNPITAERIMFPLRWALASGWGIVSRLLFLLHVPSFRVLQRMPRFMTSLRSKRNEE